MVIVLFRVDPLPALHFNGIPSTLILIMKVRARLLVRGLVQGVGFRYFVFNRAKALGIEGYARNLYSGDVEIEVEADRSLIEEFIAEVKVGPRTAQVTDIKIDWLKYEGLFTGFDIR